MKEKRVAIVYDWFDSWGGAERVLQELIKIYPDADLYTSFYDRRRARWIPEEKRSQIHTSFLQKFPSWMLRRKKLLTILFPIAFESFDLSGYDLVVSVSSSFAKGVITRPETLHLCYLLTPTRFLWLYPDEYLGKLTRRLCAGLISYLHKWDLIAAQRPDRYIVISDTVRTRLKTIYGRDGDVLYPPLALSYWKALEKTAPRRRLPDNFFLVVSRVEPYKRLDIILDIFRHLPQEKLVVVGTGTLYEKLKLRAPKNVLMLGSRTDSELAYLYDRATALIMPQEEDFGYTPIEALFFGTPTIAYGVGGASETVREGKTGLLVADQTPEAFVHIISEKGEKLSAIKDGLADSKQKYLMPFDEKRFRKTFITQSTK